MKREMDEQQQEDKGSKKFPRISLARSVRPLVLLALGIGFAIAFFFRYRGRLTFDLRNPYDSWMVFLGIATFVAVFATGEIFLAQLAASKEADRPWIGFPHVSAVFHSSRVRVTLKAVNGGRSPARVLDWKYGLVCTDQWSGPVYKPSGYGRSILISGMEMETTFEAERKWGEQYDIYAFTEIVYEDLRSGRSHFTKACWQFSFSPNDRFVHCKEYNDAN